MPAPPSRTKVTSVKRGALAGQWRSIIIAGGADTGGIDYHTGGAGTAGRGGWHTGEDIGRSGGGSYGAGIRIPLGGTVVGAGWGVGGGSAFGNAVLVKLNNGDYMFFAHLSSIKVKKGDKLTAGNFIGRVGSTGNSTGAHLHLEIRRASSGGKWSRTDSTFYNPVSYLDKETRGIKYDLSGEGSARTTPSSGDDEAPASTTTTTTTESRDKAGDGVAKSGFSKKEFYADLETMFGDLDTLLTIDAEAVKENGGKSIRWAIDEAVKQKITDPDRFLTLLNKTAWFKKYGQETTKRMILERSKPELFATSKNEVQAAIAQHAANLGIVLDEPTLNQLARDAYIYQWEATSATVLDRIQKSTQEGGATFAGGTIAESLEDLDEYSRAFGVEMSESDVTQLRNDVLDGLGDQRMKEILQERSAQTYSVFAEQIREGVSLRSVIDPYLRTAADLLEVSAEEMDMTDPLFTQGRAFQVTDPGSGKIVQRTLADFQDMVRKDVRWEKTENAKKTAAETASGILKQMGLI